MQLFCNNEEEDDLYEYIELLKRQILSIVVTQNPNGSLNFNTQSAKAKKDLYSCFIMGCWMINQISKERERPAEQEQILSYTGIINNRMSSTKNQYIDRIKNFGDGIRPLVVPTVL